MKSSKHGFTLVEILIALPISLLVVSMMLAVLLSMQKVSYEIGDCVVMNSMITQSHGWMIRDFRSMTTISSATETSISATTKEYNTGVSADVTYTLESNRLNRYVGGVFDRTIVSNISTDGSSKFIYKNRSKTAVDGSRIDEIVSMELHIVPVKNVRQQRGMTRVVNIPYNTINVYLRNKQ